MRFSPLLKRLAPTLCAAAVLAAGVTAEAQMVDPVRAQNGRMNTSPACESARLSAWFERQRQLTDGDVDPRKTLPTPRECADTSAMRSKDMADRESASTAELKSVDARKEVGATY